ncbi:MAG: YgcG family protein [SAR324 cluster bacterium]|uniref:YgcG family protein n=1 Tax=SAR324 cluster bacterium TaxID=2024889 RepID=A0A7X9IKH2_9DELT|nr:YgcG family protein [SAR324 cluster bacterium]
MKTWTLYYRKVRETDKGGFTTSLVCLNIYKWPNRHLFILFWAFLNLLLAFPLLSNAQIEVPKLEARVNDLTGTLTSQQKAQLENQLAEFEQKKGSQIGVLIIPSTEGEAIEAFGIRVAEAWKLGRKRIDDGAILIIAKNDRRLRIEVGYGLEGVLNDATCKRIISEIITPHFKSGDYFQGILSGISTMIRLIDGEALPEVQATTHRSSGIEALIVPSIFIVLILSTVLKSALGDIQAAGIMSGLSFFVLIFAAVGFFVALFVALIVFILVFFSDINGRGISNSSHFGGGFFGSGGSFGGGGFSGGGGSFGGGGASGSW